MSAMGAIAAIGTIASIVRTAIVAKKAIGSVIDEVEVAEQVKETIQSDPVLMNQMNGERWYQSRVILGVGAGNLMSSVVFFLNLAAPEGAMGYTWDIWVTHSVTVVLAGGAALSTLYGLWGRVRSGLKPLFGG